MKPIDVRVILSIIKILPLYQKYEKENCVIKRASVDPEKEYTLHFRKNHKTHDWQIIKIKQ